MIKNKKNIKFTSLELCVSKIVGDLLLITMDLFQVSSSPVQSIFFHFGNLIVLKETKTN